MARLENTRHEIFAGSLAKGISAAQAYVAAGYRRNDGNAIRLKRNERVCARVAELLDQAAASDAPDIARVVRELAAVAFSDITKVLQWKGAVEEVITSKDDGGNEIIPETVLRSENKVRIVDSDLLDAGTSAAIQEVSQSKDGSVRVRMIPKTPALLKLLEYLEAAEKRTNEQPAPITSPNSGDVSDFKAALRRYSGPRGLD